MQTYDHNTYPPQPVTSLGPTMNMPTPIPTSRSAQGLAGYYNPADMSADSHDPGPRVSVASDPYGGYDEGLGAIGMAATSRSPEEGMPGGSHDYAPDANYGHSYDPTQHQGYDDGQVQGGGGYGQNQGYGQSSNAAQYAATAVGYTARSPVSASLHVPTPQHLLNPNSSNILTSPIDGHGPGQAQRGEMLNSASYGGGQGQSAHDYRQYDSHPGNEDDTDLSMRPPSYGAVAGSSGYQPPPEKSSYR
jgi:hypothetical protein